MAKIEVDCDLDFPNFIEETPVLMKLPKEILETIVDMTFAGFQYNNDVFSIPLVSKKLRDLTNTSIEKVIRQMQPMEENLTKQVANTSNKIYELKKALQEKVYTTIYGLPANQAEQKLLCDLSTISQHVKITKAIINKKPSLVNEAIKEASIGDDIFSKNFLCFLKTEISLKDLKLKLEKINNIYKSVPS